MREDVETVLAEPGETVDQDGERQRGRGAMPAGRGLPAACHRAVGQREASVVRWYAAQGRSTSEAIIVAHPPAANPCRWWAAARTSVDRARPAPGGVRAAVLAWTRPCSMSAERSGQPPMYGKAESSGRSGRVGRAFARLPATKVATTGRAPVSGAMWNPCAGCVRNASTLQAAAQPRRLARPASPPCGSGKTAGATSESHYSLRGSMRKWRCRDADFLQIDYSLEDRAAEQRLLPLMAELRRGCAGEPAPAAAGPGWRAAAARSCCGAWAADIGCNYPEPGAVEVRAGLIPPRHQPTRHQPAQHYGAERRLAGGRRGGRRRVWGRDVGSAPAALV